MVAVAGKEGDHVLDIEAIPGGVGGDDFRLDDKIGLAGERAGSAAQGRELKAFNVYFDEIDPGEPESGDLGIHGGNGDAGIHGSTGGER